MRVVSLCDRDMKTLIGIKLRKDNSFLVLAEYLYMGRIDIIGTVASDKTVFLAKLLQRLH